MPRLRCVIRLSALGSMLAVLTLIIAPSAAAQTAPSAPRWFRGQVVDKWTGEVIPGVILVVVGTSRGGSTDLDGRFLFDLVLAASEVGWPVEVEVRYPGRVSQVWTVPARSAQASVVIGLDDANLCGDC